MQPVVIVPHLTTASSGGRLRNWPTHRVALSTFAAGGRIVEVPITFVEPRQGQSTLSGRVIVESALAALVSRGRRSSR
jgi:hypothetical protein